MRRATCVIVLLAAVLATPRESHGVVLTCPVNGRTGQVSDRSSFNAWAVRCLDAMPVDPNRHYALGAYRVARPGPAAPGGEYSVRDANGVHLGFFPRDAVADILWDGHFKRIVRTVSTGVASSPMGVQQQYVAIIIQDVAMPNLPTRAEAQEAAAKVQDPDVPGLALSTSGRIWYEDFDLGLGDGHRAGGVLGLTGRKGKTQYGVIIPYDRIGFDILGQEVDTDRVGIVVYGKHRVLKKGPVQAEAGASTSYYYQHSDYETRRLSDDSMHMVGVGPFARASFDAGFAIVSLASTYQYTVHDEAGSADAHIVKSGTNLGVPIGDKVVVNAFAVHTWTVDDNFGHADKSDDQFHTLGGSVRLAPSGSFSIEVGAQTVRGMRGFKSVEGFVGGRYQY